MKLNKIIKSLFVVAMILISTICVLKVEATTSAPSTITVTAKGQLPGYVGGTYFVKKATTDGKYVYCMDISLKTPNNMKLTLDGDMDAGMAYIMRNGYPNKSITGNSDYDYYITQTAVWWYLDDTTGSSNLSNNFKTTGSDPHGLRKHIVALKDAAKNAKNEGYTQPSVSVSSSSDSLTLSSDGKYFYSSDITISGKSLDGNITLSLSGAPEGSVIVDNNGNIKTTVTSGTKIKIRVPVEKVTNLQSTITITAQATGKIDKAYNYKPSDNRYQPVVVGVLFSETKAVNAAKKFTLKTSSVEILKVDSETQKPLAGAKLQLKNSKGEIVDTWTSTTSSHIIKNLPSGTYKLRELEAPTGYKLDDTEQEVTITAGVVTKVSFFNSKKEPTKVIIIKRDKETNETLAGAIFVLKDLDGNEITSWTSTEKGHYVSGLAEGEYTIEEIQAPDGYIRDTEIKTVKLESGKTVTVTFYNQKEEVEEPESILKINKVNGETGEALAGATLVLKDSNGEELATWTTTTEAYVLKDVKPGTYYLSETSAPEGFILSTEVVEIIVTEDGGTQIVTFYNIPEVEVPNTSANISIITIVLGIIAMGIGGSIIYFNLRKEEM